MTSGKTVFVLGAGASSEVGLPVGEELKERIASVLEFPIRPPLQGRRTDAVVALALKHAIQGGMQPSLPESEIVLASRHLRDAMPLAISIDNLLDAWRGDSAAALCAKVAIGRVILQAESESRLMIDPDSSVRELDLAPIADTWFIQLMRLLTENCTLHEFVERL